MSPEFKPVAEALLQARVNGKLQGSTDFFDVLKLLEEINGVEVDIKEMSDFIEELIPCDIISEAKKVAEKYDLCFIKPCN